MFGTSRLAAVFGIVVLSACVAPATPRPSVLPSPSLTASRVPASPPTPRPSPVSSPQPSDLSSSPSLAPTGTPGSTASPAAFDPTRVAISTAVFAEGLDSPLFATGRRNGTNGLLVVERPGRIRIVDSDGTLEPTPFLDISDHVVSGGERGLLGLALGPDYEHDGLFYVDYTSKPDGATVISEFRADDRYGDPSSERILLTIPQPFPNHNGGMLAFDAKGMLVIGMGDGGSGSDPLGNGQNPTSLLGKLLRIDPNGNPYNIPADNPFATSAGTAPEIWDLGMRNPWRFSFDRLTGDLFVGDVGQDAWEEVDAEPAGQGGHNYGWNTMEASHCFNPASGCDQNGLTLPVAEYGHGPECSITGGYVYRGSAFPILKGGYIFGDYCSGTIWGLSAAEAIATGSAQPAVLATTNMAISSFAQGDAGELYVLDINSGQVLSITAALK